MHATFIRLPDIGMSEGFKLYCCTLLLFFTALHNADSLVMRILSVRLSVKHVDCDKTEERSVLYRFLANVNSSSGSLYVVVRPSVVCRLSVCLSSVTFVHPTQAIEIFGNVFTPFGTLAIRYLCIKILRRSSQGNPSIWG